jgi:hypothetical protein
VGEDRQISNAEEIQLTHVYTSPPHFVAVVVGFCFFVFETESICLGWPQTCGLPTSAS